MSNAPDTPTPEEELNVELELELETPTAEDFGFDEGEADDGPEADPDEGPVLQSDDADEGHTLQPKNSGYFDDEEVAGKLSADEDGYLDPTSLPEAGAGTVVVQDFDPADPGAEIAEPQKVLKPHDRIARKRARGSRE